MDCRIARAGRVTGLSLVAALCGAIIALGLSFSARWPLFALAAPAALGLAAALGAVRARARSGLAVVDGQFEIWHGETMIRRPLDDVAAVEVHDGDDSADWQLRMKDGSAVELPGPALPPRTALDEALARYAVEIRRI